MVNFVIGVSVIRISTFTVQRCLDCETSQNFEYIVVVLSPRKADSTVLSQTICLWKVYLKEGIEAGKRHLVDQEGSSEKLGGYQMTP